MKERSNALKLQIAQFILTEQKHNEQNQEPDSSLIKCGFIPISPLITLKLKIRRKK